ncbi:MAG: hypothetical protein ABL916_01660 [Burkholderiaceae bacterium]
MKRVVLCLFLVLTFRTFQFFPLFTYVQEAYFAFGLGILIFALFHRRHETRIAESPFVRYLTVLVVLAPLWSAVAAMMEYGQPIVYGLLSLRGVGLLAGSVGLLYMARFRMVSVKDVEQSFVFLAWATFALYVAMRVLLTPAEYVDYGKGFIENRGADGYRFNFSQTFIIVGMIYYFLKAFRRRRPSLYLPAVVLFAFLLGDAGGRTLTISTLVTLGFFYARWSNAWRLVRVTALAAVVVGASVAVGSVVNHEATIGRLEQFRDAFLVVLSGAEVDDPSANARALQSVTALPLVEKNFWVGNGNVSYQWSDGSVAGLLGEYFYPADIGLLGVVYLYGALGTVLFAIQYIFAVKEARRSSSQRHQAFKDCVNGFLLFTGISSIVTGYFCHFPEVVCTMIICLMLANSPARPRQLRRNRIDAMPSLHP